jgi:cardiolipin synthase (CMP-forming)
MTLANRITITRLALVPAVAALVSLHTPEVPWVRWAALAVFLIASLSDGIDGYVARHYNQKTRLGAVLDPMADKLLTNFTLVFLAVNHAFSPGIPLWFPVVLLARDIVIVVGSYVINEHYRPTRIRPTLSGKLHTVLVLAVIVAVIAGWGMAEFLIHATLVVALVSLAEYIRDGIRQAFYEGDTHVQAT